MLTVYLNLSHGIRMITNIKFDVSHALLNQTTEVNKVLLMTVST